METVFRMLLERLSLIGQVPLCNGMAHRAPHIFGFCFPICYRCLFIMLGFGISYFLLTQTIKKIPWFIGILLMIPMLIDGFTQTLTTYESTNIKRVLTGSMFGIGFAIVILAGIVYLDKKRQR